MKTGFRQCMAWLHTWVGLLTGWVLFFVFVTGTAGYFAFEIDRWMQPERPLLSEQATPPTAAMLALAQAHLQALAPDAQAWNISLPLGRSEPGLRVWWRALPAPGQRYGAFTQHTLDPETGKPIDRTAARATGGGHLLYRMHYLLHYLPVRPAILLVGVCTMLMLLAIVSGVIAHKKIFADFFTFRPRKGQRSWLDAHNLVSVMALPFFLMITYSGLVFFQVQYMPAPLAVIYGGDYDAYFADLSPEYGAPPRSGRSLTVPRLETLLPTIDAAWGDEQVARINVMQAGDRAAEVQFFRRAGHGLGGSEQLRVHALDGTVATMSRSAGPASKTRDAVLGLHEGSFAGPWLRWLYFVSGLAGCAMVATGLVLWTAKRQVQQEKRLQAGQSVAFGFRLVACLNIGTVAGLCTAVAVYFWANRLIPADLPGRAAWEAHAMFIAWGLLLVHPAFRPARRAWMEQLWLAAFAFGLLPVVNAITTDRHLGVTLPAGDWVLAGFDLTTMVLGTLFAFAAMKLMRKPGAPRAEHESTTKAFPSISDSAQG